ncbi:hypothetical protein GRI62_00940 [Erythrobacter arachoides]|uniref:50S ribosomal protein L7/L12 domain protein n=1 Tax=Aurantiacibacter arachoides TaxID=1850444 RepID=A0A844ZV32_9SPHN|nr:hypothetical protein [Aurantiacibacter arachoides]MXO92171.1 hypothetical protein [Aurantiacibacter arachoides]GGD59136.1 hypothetical protein GCM10011411_19190 [Aurantiacibacter arachoides]
MKRLIVSAMLFATTASFGLAACSGETQESAELAAEGAARDAAANAEVAGEALQDGAVVAADKISEGAANLSNEIRESDNEEPGPAPITGDDLGPPPSQQ